MLFLFFIFIGSFAYADTVDIDTKNQWKVDSPNVPYRPGIRFQNVSLENDLSLQNKIDTPSVYIEQGMHGRSGNIYIDGAHTKPLLGIDGFVLKNISINEGQMPLHFLPYDFSTQVDVYKQNLAPFGITAGSMLDFRIPIKNTNSHELLLKGSSIGNLYAKYQNEITFQGGSTTFGVVGDFGLMNYYYGINNGQDFKTYPGSTYNRSAVLSKTKWKDWELLLAYNFYNGFNDNGGENPSCSLTGNTLLSGIRYQGEKLYFTSSYYFFNLFAENLLTPSVTNDYNSHVFNTFIGVKDQLKHLSYNVGLGYENRILKDGDRGSIKNYTTTPKHGENDVNLLTELTAHVFDLTQKRDLYVNIHFSLNQIITGLGDYTPIPGISMDIIHKNGLMFSMDLSRVYVVPDFTSMYGFGSYKPIAKLLPKDGIRVGGELMYSHFSGSVFLNASYAWLDRSFRLDNNIIENANNVNGVALELGGEYKHIVNSMVLKYRLTTAFNYEKDQNDLFASPSPLVKIGASFLMNSINNDWELGVFYKILMGVPIQKEIDFSPRHYLDLKTRYKFFVFNLLNILNQSYYPQPNNIYVPVNPGVRVEVGIRLTF